MMTAQHTVNISVKSAKLINFINAIYKSLMMAGTMKKNKMIRTIKIIR